jgi:acetyl-CoA carboxylase carboxyl transferase subunit alpha
MAALRVPTITVVIGEGGSGGALGIGVTDRILMMENSVYSVISPEGCAAILWKSGSERDKAAAALKITAPDLAQLGVIDEIVPEPAGGSHSDWERTAGSLKEALVRHLGELKALSPEDLLSNRRAKFLAMGEWHDA